ncbi:MAG: ATP-binding protein [Pseudomonadota bacterium]
MSVASEPQADARAAAPAPIDRGAAAEEAAPRPVAAPWWPRGLFKSAVNRLIAIHFGLVAAATTAVLAYVFVSTSWLLESQTREVVTAELRDFQDEYQQRGLFGLAGAIARRAARESGGESVYLLTNAAGGRIAGNLAAWPADIAPGQGWVELELSRTDRREGGLVKAASVQLPGGVRLLVGRDAEALRAFDRTLLQAVISAVLGLALLTLLIGSALSRLLRRRLALMEDAAAEIMSGDLERRIAETGGDDEFDRLARRLNAMLERIGALVGDLRMVTDSVAHDLRSPLTRLRSHLEAALAEADAGRAAPERIERALSEAEAVLEAFSGLLAIARAEAGVGREQFEPVALRALLGELADLYAPAAEERGLALRLAPGAPETAPAHRQLLAQAAANLIENALNHAPIGSAITLSVARRETAPGFVALAVADAGPGVPAAQRAQAFKRFAQLDPSRGGGGAGLGLALVAAVARLHGGEARLCDAAPGAAPPGLRAEILLRA